MKFASTLPADAELAIVYCGQSNSRPWGTREEAEGEDSRFNLADAGINLTLTPDFPSTGRSTYQSLAGQTGVLVVTSPTTLVDHRWEGADLRLGTVEAPVVGTGTVIANRTAGSAAAGVAVTTDNITDNLTLIDHDFIDGAPVFITSGTSDIIDGEYFVEAVDTDQFKIHVLMARATKQQFGGGFCTGGGAATLDHAATSGTASAGTATTLTDAGAGWTVSEHVGRRIEITGGTGAHSRKVVILSNTADTITVAGWAGAAPDATSTYTIEWRTNELVGVNVNMVDGPAAGDNRTVLSNTGIQITVGSNWTAPPVSGNIYLLGGNLAGNPDGEVWEADGTGTKYHFAQDWIAVTWDADMTVQATPLHTTAWVTHSEEKWKYFKGVRVLTPYVPEVAGKSPPGTPVIGAGFQTPATFATWDDVGLFLEHTFLEGVEGPGKYEAGNAAITPGATGFTGWSGMTANLYVGGHARVITRASASDSTIIGVSSGTIKSNTATDIVLEANWAGGTPPTTPGTPVYDIEVFIPHWGNNPHAITAGDGFRRPNNDSQPFGPTTPRNGGKIHNRPRDIETYGYGNRFGAMLPCAYQLSAHLGRRVNVIHLGINSAGLFEQAGHNAFGFQGEVGFWNPDDYLDWHAGRSEGSFARLTKMIKTMAPGAITAETAVGSTAKKLYIIGIVYYQGEADTLIPETRLRYRTTLPAFATALRRVIDESGHNLYDRPDQIPFIQPVLPKDPWELDGAAIQAIYGLPNAPDGDVDGYVNATITDFTACDEYAGSWDTNGDDRTKLGETSLVNGIDPLHFDGKGEVNNGLESADVLAGVIDESWGALSVSTDQEVVDICNEALAVIGELEVSITSLDDATTVGRLCKKFFNVSKKQLLERHPFSFATVRQPLTALSKLVRKIEWQHAYGKPANCARVFSVAPEGTTDDVSLQGQPLRHPFRIETLPDLRLPVLYTDVEKAVARFTVTTTGIDQFSSNLRTALVWLVASKLIGALAKGEEGRKGVRESTNIAEAYLRAASQLDASSHKTKASSDHRAEWHQPQNR